MAAEFLTSRSQGRAVLQLSAQEKQERKQRQLARYGRTYRAGLQEQISDMKAHLHMLETRHDEYRRYKSFVDMIDRQLFFQPSITHDKKEQGDRPQKTITNLESSLKVSLKAQMLREHVPLQYRPPGKNDTVQLGQATTANKGLDGNNKTTRIETNLPLDSKELRSVPELKRDVNERAGAKFQAQKLAASFTGAASLDKYAAPDLNPTWKQKITGFDPLKSRVRESKSVGRSDRQPWFIPAGENMTAFDRAISARLNELNPPEIKPPHDTSRLKGAFNFNAENTRRTTNEAHRAKIRAEAEIKRAQVPLEYRAQPYDPEPQAQDLKSRVQSGVKGAQDALKNKWEGFRAGEQDRHEQQAQAEKPRVKMSDTFNRGSFEGVDKTGQDHLAEEGLGFDAP